NASDDLCAITLDKFFDHLPTKVWLLLVIGGDRLRRYPAQLSTLHFDCEVKAIQQLTSEDRVRAREGAQEADLYGFLRGRIGRCKKEKDDSDRAILQQS